MSKELIQSVKQRFKTQFEGDPLMVFSPGRINLIGEHTDYNDGFVFPAAIDLGIVLALKKSSSKTSRVYALNKKEMCEISLNQISPQKNGGWRNYVIGVIGELQKQGINIGNFEGVFAGNIPGGSGMSSSAALENSFVYGLNKLFDLGLKKKEMIFISQRAEHNFVGVHCGIMDQYASMLGKKKSPLLLDCRTMKSTPYKLKLKSLKLVLVNTNVKHDLSESAYNDRRAVCEKVAKLLNVKTLRDTSEKYLNTVKNQIPKSDFNKALYVILENERVEKFAKAIEQKDFKLMGELMYETHEGLSKNYKVSCEELDFLVETTKSMDFVHGSKMMGGGFGGCTINLVEQRNIDDFKSTIENKFKAIFNRSCSIYDVNISKGTHLI